MNFNNAHPDCPLTFARTSLPVPLFPASTLQVGSKPYTPFPDERGDKDSLFAGVDAPAVEPPTPILRYSGKREHLVPFVVDFESARKRHDWDHATAQRFLRQRLDGTALLVYDRLAQSLRGQNRDIANASPDLVFAYLFCPSIDQPQIAVAPDKPRPATVRFSCPPATATASSSSGCTTVARLTRRVDSLERRVKWLERNARFPYHKITPCQLCGKRGHIAPLCWHLRDAASPKQAKQQQNQEFLQKPGAPEADKGSSSSHTWGSRDAQPAPVHVRFTEEGSLSEPR